MMRAGAMALAAAVALAGCEGDSPTPTPAATPSPTPTATVTAYNVENCFTQIIPGTNGQTLRSLIVPDTVKLDLTRPAAYPNGRDLDDKVIDITLAALFLDFTVTGQSPDTFANLPLNPPANDKPFSATFPYLADPWPSSPEPAPTAKSIVPLVIFIVLLLLLIFTVIPFWIGYRWGWKRCRRAAGY